MTQQYVPNLGETPAEDARRDAVHVAVAPLVAREWLEPGQHVGLLDGKVSKEVGRKIGVVDPFLKKSVAAGERCWVFLYPNTVTSLRHVWSHPDFKAKLPEGVT